MARRWSRPAWFGTLHRTAPLSDQWGYDRGLPIDRHYIEQFLAKHRGDFTGDGLEIGDDRYLRSLGSMKSRAVLDLVATERASIVADLCDREALPSERFDLFVCSQTLQYVRDVPLALQNARAMLRPGGVLLATVPALAGVDRGARDADRWRFTAVQLRAWAEEAFGAAADIRVESYGNVLTACGALMGLSRQDFSSHALAQQDPLYPVILSLRAVR